MGIKDLWSVLTPFCERKPLFELEGKNVAIDLSGWVCQAQCITEYEVQPRMYLRNLYFRTCYLLLHGINPVFVLEGKAPTLKHKTISARNLIQFKGSRPREGGAAPTKTSATGGRSRFHHVLKQCEDMLKLMGLACITGKGEAEAMCAHLNANGFVSGCISQDSDCFAYGAEVVYRNFTISQQGHHASSGGSVDVYNLRCAEEALGFGRNKVIALALFCGSDYNEGVFGIGKDSVLKFLSGIPDKDILVRIRSWRSRESAFTELEKEYGSKNVCNQCGHNGNKAAHTRSGCSACGTRKGCDFSKNRERMMEVRNEINIRNKALADSNFPDEELVEEYLKCRESVQRLELNWKLPDIRKFISFTKKYLQWQEIYCLAKFLPILTRWLVINPKCESELKPDYIRKCRNPKGVNSYEIIWKCEPFLKNIPDEQLEDQDVVKLCSTTEPRHLVDVAYPELVAAYEQSKIKPKKPKKPRKTKNKPNTLSQFIQKQASLDSSLFGDEDDDKDLSLIIEDMTSQGLPSVVQKKLDEMRRANVANTPKMNTSTFFFSATNEEEIDLFEATFNQVEEDSSSEDSEGPNDEADDSFEIQSVPLLERLKSKMN